jgi:hypothetical protein
MRTHRAIAAYVPAGVEMRELVHYFTPAERSYCAGRGGRPDRWLGHLAAKRAVACWLAARGVEIPPGHVEIRHSRGGAPFATVPTKRGEPRRDVPVTIAHTRVGGAAVAGAAQATGVDLVESSRFARLTDGTERALLQRRLVGAPEPPLSHADLRWIACTKEAIGKVVDAGAAGLRWNDAFLSSDDQDLDRPHVMPVDWFGPVPANPQRRGGFEIRGQRGTWAWWLLDDGTSLAVALL